LAQQDKPGAIGWLTEEWTARLSSSIELMTEAAPGLNAGSPVPASAAPADALWLSIPLDLEGDAAVFIGAAEATWLQIGKSALQAAGVEDATLEDARGTYLEIVVQATSGLASAIGVRLGKSVASLAAEEVNLVSQDLLGHEFITPVEISLRESPLGKLYVRWSEGLELALAPSKSVSVEPTGPAPAPKREAPEKSRTFDLLMEVELPVSVSFGRAQLPLRDVLKLNSGSIVELNRTISDPVEIIVNNCVIARGEVVVIKGNYGVRIQHVISREERLRTLK
jgi:flagellar motor switch protein FliN/FliY